MAEAGPSFLDAIGQSILDSASSIDAHIDAGALIDRISGDATSSSAHRARQFALSELKALAKRAPGAVVATEGAVVAILRVVEKLSPKGDEEIEDENVESLQEALECLGYLMDDSTTKAVGKGEVKEMQQDGTRAQLVAELAVKHSENGKQLLRLLSVGETSTQYDALVLLQKIYRRLPEPVNSAILADPRSLGHMMNVLQSSPIEYIRNESLGLLLLITASNADIQTIVTVQGFIETIFSILEDEDLTAGGKVARDLLQCLINVVGNPTCQKYLRETNGAASIVSAISSVITGKPSDEDEDDFEEYEKREGEHRWSCLSLLVDASLALVEGDQAEANRLALVKAGALELLQHLAEPMAEAPQLRLLRVFEALEPCPQAAERLQSFARRRAPLLFDLVAVLLGPVTPLTLRNALGRVLCRCIARHSSLQSFLCSSLGPELQEEPNEATPAGRLVVELLEAAARGGGASSDSLWFALQLLLATLVGNANVQTACVAMPVSIPSDAGPAETFQELLFRAFSAMARTVGAHANEADSDGRPNELACLVGFLKLLLYWLANCPPVLSSFATSPVMIPVAMDLTAFSGAGAFYGVQIQGLACLIMGACIMSESEAVDSMSLISQRIGIETFQHKVECLWRSEALQRPARSLGEFRWFNGHYRGFVREHQRAVQRRMVQLYVSQGVGGSGLSEDVADHYKQLIRVQAQAEEQSLEIDALQEQLQSCSRTTTAPTSAEALEGGRWTALGGDGWREKPSMTLLEERTNRQLQEVRGLAIQSEASLSRRGKEAEAQKELEEQRSLSVELQSELRALELELSKIGEEANNKIEAANVRIRALRREREEAQRQLEERREGNMKLQSMLEEIEEEKSQLMQQKEALIRIVEDLHSSCTQAGLPATDRASIDSITGFKMPS